jgi:CheY-like chemotaxis protein
VLGLPPSASPGHDAVAPLAHPVYYWENSQPKLTRLGMRAARSARPLMTINNVRMLASRRRITQLVLAERSQSDCAIAVRAIRRLLPDLEVRPVMNLAEAESLLTGTRPATVVVASGLDDRTSLQTIRWFARKTCGIVIAMLEHCDERHRQEALEAGASCVWSKPELLVAQLRYELWARLGCAQLERPRLLG